MKEDELGETCSTKRLEVHAGFWSEILKGRNHLEDMA
jgi:hypothetical protein